MATGNRNTTAKKRQTKKERMAELEKARVFRQEIILWIIVAVSLLLFISNFGWGGVVGRYVSNVLFGVFGLVAYVLPVLLLIGSFFGVSNRGNFLASVKLVAGVVFVLFFCTFLALALGGKEMMEPLKAYQYCAVEHSGGGIAGGFIAFYMAKAFGVPGSYIITIVVLIVCLVLITERSALRGLQKGGQKVYDSARESNGKYRKYREEKSRQRQERRMDRKVRGVSADTKIEEKTDERSDEMGEIHMEGEISIVAGEILSDAPVSVAAAAEEPVPQIRETVVAERVERPERPVNHSYVFPPADLLRQASCKKSGSTEHQLRETANKLQTTLQTFGVNVTVTNISCGPAVTRYEIQPEMGVKVSKIVGLADDIKLNLAAPDIRIEAPIPGKAAIGIEVPNPENVMVSFRELIESKEFQKSKSKISFAVGKDISGRTMVTDIAKMPHLLIAGATGSGKSVCINTIIMSILYKADPQEVKLLMIDPKVVELSVYNGIPHLIIPVVTDPKKASGALQWAVAEMTDRYEKFAQANVREIGSYNAKVDSLKVPEGQERPQRMPQIVIIVDELADLMMVASNDIEESICRLAQLARAAGIHLVIATQRPSVNVITGLIKANMPSRIAFAVTSGVDSRTILDMNGAEKLLGKGDMLFHPQGIPKPLRVQGAFVSDQEVSDIVSFIKRENGMASYSDSVQEKVESLQTSGNTTVAISDPEEDDDGRDAYFREAGQIIVDKEKASIGMLQRYLKVGFNRAARIMDQLQEAGVVGPEEGTKPRKVLMTPEEFESFLKGSEI